MEVEPQQSAISAAFPAPPPFYKSFTPENVERAREHSNQSLLPPELRNLAPPKPPRDGTYRCFGVEYDISSPTSTQPVPTRQALLDLTDHLLKMFLRYVQILATDPSGQLWVPQWEQIRNTFEEIHKIINEYRPHQARETLTLLMEDQIKQFEGETQRIRASVAKAKEVMETLGAGNEVHAAKPPGFDKTANTKTQTVDKAARGNKDLAKSVWNIIDGEELAT